MAVLQPYAVDGFVVVIDAVVADLVDWMAEVVQLLMCKYIPAAPAVVAVVQVEIEVVGGAVVVHVVVMAVAA